MKRALAILVVSLATLLLANAGVAEPAADRTVAFHVEGMTCALCAKAIERNLRGVDGVHGIVIDDGAERVEITVDTTVAAARLERAIEDAGPYQAEPLE